MTDVSAVSAMLIAQVEREQAARQAADAAATLPSAPRNGNSVSTVFTVRLDHEELACLRRRAEIAGSKPSVLARTLIRTGLQRPRGSAELLAAAAALEAALAQLRSALG